MLYLMKNVTRLMMMPSQKSINALIYVPGICYFLVLAQLDVWHLFMKTR